MAVTGNHKALLRQLKKQVSVLQRKEAQSRNKLRLALKKMRKLGREYKSKLASKVRMMEGKIAETQASTYIKIAADIERQMLKGIETKARSLRMAIDKLEKKHISKLARSIAKKGRKVSKVKKRKTAISVSAKLNGDKRPMKKGRARS